MLKKSLLSLAVAASLGVTGCNISSTSGNADAESVQPDVTPEELAAQRGVFPIFDPANSALPLGADLIFATQSSTSSVPAALKDGTADTGIFNLNTGEYTWKASAVTRAVDDLPGGISTVAPIDIQLSGTVEPNTVTAGSTVQLVRLPNTYDSLPLASGGTGALTVPDGVDTINPLDIASIASNYFDLTTFQPLAEFTANVGAMATFQPDPDGPANDGVDADYEVSVISLDGGVNNTIRIIPTKPLDAQTKYVVVLTKGITDTSGNAINSSIDYEYIKTTDAEDLWSSNFSGVQSSIKLWEALAQTMLGGLSISLDSNDIALTTAFTTVDPHSMMKSITAPRLPLTQLIDADAANKVLLAAGMTPATGAGADAANIATALNVAEQLIADADAKPEARTFTAIDGNGASAGSQIPVANLAAGLPADLQAVASSLNVLFSQGAIELPQYTTTLSADASGQWVGNETIAGILDGVNGEEPIPTDIDGVRNVSWRFPFVQEQRKAVVPVLMIEPTAASAGVLGACGAKPASGWPAIIFQHGITVHRGAAALMGATLAEKTCSTVVAIDLPHHGIAPTSSDKDGNTVDESLLALTTDTNVLATIADGTTASAIITAAGMTPATGDGADEINIATAKALAYPFANGVATAVAADSTSLLASLSERHEGLTQNALGQTIPMTYGSVAAGTATGKSGDFFIRLDVFQRTRDNLQQAVMDLLNLNASLDAIDVDGISATDDIDETQVSFVGHSLGAIVGGTFVAINNDATVNAAHGGLPTIDEAVLATPGGGLPKLLENSVSIGLVEGGLLDKLNALAGFSQGDLNLEKFLSVFQATVDTADPINYVSALSSGAASATETLLIEVIGGNTVAEADVEKLPSSVSGLGIYLSDLVVPNNATSDNVPTGSPRAETAKTPMAGTDILIDLINAQEVTTAGSTAATHVVTKFNTGTHGTFSSADILTAFQEMAGQAATFIVAGGASVTVQDASVIGTPAQ